MININGKETLIKLLQMNEAAFNLGLRVGFYENDYYCLHKIQTIVPIYWGTIEEVDQYLIKLINLKAFL